MTTSRPKRPKRCNRTWGRRIRVDSLARLKELIELIGTALPIDMHVDLCQPRESPLSKSASLETIEAPEVVHPIAFGQQAGDSHSIFTMRPFVIEVRVSLLINEHLGWLLPVYFCLGELLTADEVITKIWDAFRILKIWSAANTQEYLLCPRRGNAKVLVQ
jgi:hypothetical protein